jgi:hypothetical protein
MTDAADNEVTPGPDSEGAAEELSVAEFQAAPPDAWEALLGVDRSASQPTPTLATVPELMAELMAGNVDSDEERAHPGHSVDADPTAGPKRMWGRRVVPLALVLVLLVASVITAVLSTGKTSADAAVVEAVTSAVNDRTATLTLGGSFDVDGTAVPLTGTGSMDFTQAAEKILLHLSEPGSGQQLTETGVFVGHVMYINMGDLIGEVVPGKSWISLDLSQLSDGSASSSALGLGGSTLGSDPVAILKLLGQSGNEATDLGPSTVDGQSVEGYSVVVNQSMLRAQMARKGVPSWMQAAMAAVKNPHESYRVYVNGSGLLERFANEVTLTVGGQSVNDVATMDFSDYGVPVSIAAPPATQVTTFGDFLHTASAAASSTAD